MARIISGTTTSPKITDRNRFHGASIVWETGIKPPICASMKFPGVAINRDTLPVKPIWNTKKPAYAEATSNG